MPAGPADADSAGRFPLADLALLTAGDLPVLRVAGAPPDHPIGLHVPETRYLKAVFARVRSL